MGLGKALGSGTHRYQGTGLPMGTCPYHLRHHHQLGPAPITGVLVSLGCPRYRLGEGSTTTPV